MRFMLTVGLTVLVAGATSAHAGPYLSLGVGSQSGLQASIGDGLDAERISTGRLAAGHRLGPLAIEAVILGTGLRDTRDGTAAPAVTLAFDLKYYLGLAGPIEGYLHAGLGKTWVRGDSMTATAYAGDGYIMGGGLQYTFDWLPVGEAGFWLDYTHQQIDLSTGDSVIMDDTADVLSLGASVGF